MKSCCQHPMTRTVNGTERKETLDFLVFRVQPDQVLAGEDRSSLLVASRQRES